MYLGSILLRHHNQSPSQPHTTTTHTHTHTASSFASEPLRIDDGTRQIMKYEQLLISCLWFMEILRGFSVASAFLPSSRGRSGRVVVHSPVPTTTRRQAKKKKNSNSSSNNNNKGFGKKTTTTTHRKPTKKAMLKRLEKTYGGTSTAQITEATQRRIDDAVERLPSHVQTALRLHQQSQKWDARMDDMTVLERSRLPPEESHGAHQQQRRTRDRLRDVLDEHDLSVVDLRNTLQRLTWDASADAKAARSVVADGEMPTTIADRVDRACRFVGEAVVNVNDDDDDAGRCLDVGCGYGVTVPRLVTAGGLRLSQIHGVDLSPEMIRNARTLHGDAPTFVVADFVREYAPPATADDDDDGSGVFEAVLFCASLHDMPDMEAALAKAWSLVRPGGGRLVIVHPQGASHVISTYRQTNKTRQNKRQKRVSSPRLFPPFFIY